MCVVIFSVKEKIMQKKNKNGKQYNKPCNKTCYSQFCMPNVWCNRLSLWCRRRKTYIYFDVFCSKLGSSVYICVGSVFCISVRFGYYYKDLQLNDLIAFYC